MCWGVEADSQYGWEKEEGAIEWAAGPAEKLWDVYIAADGGGNAPEDCTYLFIGMNHLREVNWNDSFYTGNTVCMDNMFENWRYYLEDRYRLL